MNAEEAVLGRHLRRLWALPGTALGRSHWPPSCGDRVHWHWNYWWQAHLLDCLVDAQLRAPSPARADVIARFVRSVRLRNFGRWTNDYYDDIAWLGLALQRTGLEVSPALTAISAQLHSGWTDDAGGGIWWRRGDQFKNAPANGPAAIFHARAGDLARAEAIVEWMTSLLVDPETGLVWDGYRPDTGEFVKHIYTYCQGVYLGACLEVSNVEAAARTVSAVAAHCAPGGVLRGQGGGDGGLFAGITARYLALAARRLEGQPAAVARSLVLTSAAACEANAVATPQGPVYGPDWSTRATLEESRDLSIQLGAWMLLEAAAVLES
ncbi:glycoside hydrolase family 76 protein [Amycolatopsis sp. cg5]|uniref:glycoside hydrolase family 76 protein n=1 Tax=Amycolatopsis sp. cg5 TaxID=3238802 RepID=UPI003525A56F